MNILALIPARGGSKGVPRKNIRALGGRPLIAHTLDAADKSTAITRVIVSTDDAEIADYAKQHGGEVPFLRPNDAASDTAPMTDVIRHALDWLAKEENYTPDILVLLQPTCPLRTAADIDAALALLQQSNAQGLGDAVVSVTPVAAHFHPEWQFTTDEDGTLLPYSGKALADIPTRRQALTPATYTRNGAIYAVLAEAFKATNSLYGTHCLAYAMPEERSVNIDTETDWQVAERVLASHAADKIMASHNDAA